MKLGKLITGFLLSTLLAVGVGVGIGIGSGNKEVKVTKAANTDSTLEIRFTRPSDWGNNTVCIHTWDGAGKETQWPGYAMTYLWNNEYGQAVWSWSPSASQPLYPNFKFNNNNHGMESSNLVSPTTSKFYYYDNGWQSVDVPTMDVFLYDYGNKFNGNVNVHAWRNGTSFANDTFPGPNATKLIDIATNGLIYKFTMSNRYNRVIFSNNGSDQTGDLTPTGNYCYVLGDIAGGNSWWNNINYVFAHNFAQNTMMLNRIPTTDHSSTQYCSLRYSAAKTHYNALMNSGYGSYVLTELNNNFADAMTRLAAWATANGDTLDTQTGTLASIRLKSFVATKETGITLVVIISSIATVAAFAGYFFYKKKKED